MDEDDSGTLVVDEIVKAWTRRRATRRERGVLPARLQHTHCGDTGSSPRHTSRRSQKVIKFLENCGEPNLQFLVRPKTIRRALRVLDVSGDGEIDIDEWRVARRPFPRVTIHSAPNAEEAIYRGLAKRLEVWRRTATAESARRPRPTRSSPAGLPHGRAQVFDTMDKDGEGIIDRASATTPCLLPKLRSSTPRRRARSRSPTVGSCPLPRYRPGRNYRRRDDARGGQGRHGPDAGREDRQAGAQG